MKNSIRSIRGCLPIGVLGATLGVVLMGGCASSDSGMAMGYDASATRRPYTPNLYDSTVSGVEYHVSTRTTMVEGQSSLTSVPYRMTPAQRQAVEQLRELRESYQQP